MLTLPGSPKSWLLAAAAVVVVLVAIVGVVRVLPSSGTPGSATLAVAGRQASTSVTPQTPALSPAAATRVARRWFLRRDLARFDNDDAALAKLETGAALRVDRAFTIHIKCGCEPPKHLHTLNRVHVVVSNSESTMFLAHFDAIASDGIYAGYMVVLARTTGTWKAVIIALDGHDVKIRARARPSATQPTATNSTIAATAAYLQRWVVSGRGPQDSATWTGIARPTGREWAKPGQNKLNRQTNLRTDYSTVADRQTYTFPIVGGSLTCGVMEGYNVTTSPAGPLVQDEHGEPWGPLLRPGTYSSLRGTNTFETCVITRPHHVRDLLSVYGTLTSLKPGRLVTTQL